MSGCPVVGCQIHYAHRHLDSVEQLEFEDKQCGCGQIGCMEGVISA